MTSVNRKGEGERLQGILIMFTRDFQPKKPFVDSILTTMKVHGRPYRDWMTRTTPLKVLVHSDAQDERAIGAHAMVYFRGIGIAFAPERVEYATFEGSHGISGAIVTHWGL